MGHFRETIDVWEVLFLGLFLVFNALANFNDMLALNMCDPTRLRVKEMHSHHKAVVHHEVEGSLMPWLACSEVCALGKVTWFLSSALCIMYVIVDDDVRKYYKWCLLAVVLVVGTTTFFTNRPLFIRSIAAYFWLACLLSVDFFGRDYRVVRK